MYFCNFIVYCDCHIAIHTKYASTYMYVEWLISVTRICIMMNFFILWLLWYKRLIMILSQSKYFMVFGEDVVFMGKCFYLLLNKRGVIYIYMYTHGIQKSRPWIKWFWFMLHICLICLLFNLISIVEVTPIHVMESISIQSAEALNRNVRSIHCVFLNHHVSILEIFPIYRIF